MADPQGLLFGDHEPDAAAQPAAPERPLSVGELTARLKMLVESGFARIEVEGQVSGFRPHSSGHLYFTLKDDRSQIRAVMFRTDARGKEGNKAHAGQAFAADRDDGRGQKPYRPPDG
jgi:hypothetical protein